MARKLTPEQKKLLDKFKHLFEIGSLPSREWAKLVKMNDYETLYQDADRYMWDNYYKEKYKK